MNRDMLAKLSQMQEQMQKAQEEIENRVAKGTAGGGAVSAEIDGAYKVRSIKVDPDVIDPDDVSMLEDLIAAAVNEALVQVQAFHAESAAGLTGGLDLGALGLNIPGLPGAGGAPGGGLPGGAPGGMPGNRAARRANRR